MSAYDSSKAAINLLTKVWAAEYGPRSQPRHRNVYNYSGEYEFPTARHWISPDVPSLREVPVPASREGRD
jgi:hypothetical protein